MKKMTAKRINIIVGAALCGLFVSCPTNHPTSLVLLESMAMSRQSQCTIQASGKLQYIKPFGILDLAVTNHYYLFPHILNNMTKSMNISQTTTQDLGVESNFINILGATVRLEIPMDIYKKATPKQKAVLYTAMTDGYFVPASGGLQPEQDGTSELEVIRPDVGKVLRSIFKTIAAPDPCATPSAEVYVYVKMEAVVTFTGRRLTSNEYMFPIRLCWGCLVKYIVEDPKNTDIVPQGNSAPCLPGQDETMSKLICILVSLDKDICYIQNSCQKSM